MKPKDTGKSVSSGSVDPARIRFWSDMQKTSSGFTSRYTQPPLSFLESALTYFLVCEKSDYNLDSITGQIFFPGFLIIFRSRIFKWDPNFGQKVWYSDQFYSASYLAELKFSDHKFHMQFKLF